MRLWRLQGPDGHKAWVPGQAFEAKLLKLDPNNLSMPQFPHP